MKNLISNDQSLSFDVRSLGDLKRSAASQQSGAIKETAKQFEVLFMNMLMKSMRDASPKDGMMSSSAGDMYTGMLDQQFAQKMAARGTGLADVIARQLGGAGAAKDAKVGASTPASEAPTLTDFNRVTARVGSNGKKQELPPIEGRSISVRFAENSGLNKLVRSREAATVTADASATRPATKAAAMPKAGEAIGDTLEKVSDKTAAFFDRMKVHANEAANATGIPAKFMLGQAALESGWGKREIRNPDGSTSHNLFGIKAGTNWTGRTVSVTTTEYVNGIPRQSVQKFRAYSSYAESFKDYAALITKSPRYSAVASNSGSVEGFATSLQRAGYATDPRYAEKLSRTINHVIAIARTRTDAPATGWNQA
jgi:flagellar protein FlgJ